jgi:hypothetical protein
MLDKDGKPMPDPQDFVDLELPEVIPKLLFDPAAYVGWVNPQPQYNPPEPIPEGSLFTFTTGQYSEYSVTGLFKALKSIDISTLFKQWLEEHPEQAGFFNLNAYEFIAWVTKEGYLEQVDCYEWHVDDNPSSGLTKLPE